MQSGLPQLILLKSRLDKLWSVKDTLYNYKADLWTYILLFRFQGLEKVTLPERDGNIDRRRRELYWLFTLQTWSPKGLNDEIQMHVML